MCVQMMQSRKIISRTFTRRGPSEKTQHVKTVACLLVARLWTGITDSRAPTLRTAAASPNPKGSRSALHSRAS